MDCIDLYGGVIKCAMKGRVGVGLRPEDDGIKLDVYHAIERIEQLMTSGAFKCHNILQYMRRRLHTRWVAGHKIQSGVNIEVVGHPS